MENKSFAIEDMTCASCAQTVEKVAKKVRGGTQASVNLATEKLSIEYNEPTFSVENLQKAVDNSGYELIAQEGKTQTFAIEGAESVEVDLATKKAVLESQTEIGAAVKIMDRFFRHRKVPLHRKIFKTQISA